MTFVMAVGRADRGGSRAARNARARPAAFARMRGGSRGHRCAARGERVRRALAATEKPFVSDPFKQRARIRAIARTPLRAVALRAPRHARASFMLRPCASDKAVFQAFPCENAIAASRSARFFASARMRDPRVFASLFVRSFHSFLP
ncbi:hypothetical protein PRJ39_21830 [Lysobacter enzymogenes]|uniref:hypothetical protein n=1 Tax=Lysobacter enzymogenes TaxID=69 RepID=UPI00374A65DB